MANFGSDNYSGVPAEVLEAIASANHGGAVSYGDDDWTARAAQTFRRHFGDAAQPWFVTTGTAANVLSLKAVCRSWESVITTTNSHMNVDEAGAPEQMGGLKLIALATPDGKLTPADVTAQLTRVGDQHAAQPRVVSVAQCTELGTVYAVDELRALADTAHDHGLLLHVDGARLGNAAVALGTDLATACTGADILSFGGTKAGLMAAEAVVFLRPELGQGFEYVRKQHGQLLSKMRFVSAQFEALLDGDLWKRQAQRSNAMAQRLADAIADVDGLQITQRVQTNVIFAIVPREVTERLQREHRFYVWDDATGEVRWMTAWDTTDDDVDAFAASIREALA
jgi:threonine aldolase